MESNDKTNQIQPNEGLTEELDQYPALMTPKEAAEVLRCTPKHITQTIVQENPELECRPSKGKITIYRNKLREWIKSGGVKNSDNE